MDDLDSLFADARHPRLEGMETRLMARIAAERRQDLPRGLSVAMVTAALGIGLFSGQATARREPAPAVALDAGLDLAPSTRLVTDR